MRQNIQVSCPTFDKNVTLVTNTTSQFPLLMAILRGCILTNSSSLDVLVDIVETDTESELDKDSGALMYIVTVLLLYSCGIFFMIMKNLKREKHEMDEERTLDDFFRGIPISEKEREQINVHRIAIQAFNTLTSSKPQEICDIEDINYHQESTSDNPNVVFYGVDTILEDDDEEYESNYDVGSDNESEEDMLDNTDENMYEHAE